MPYRIIKSISGRRGSALTLAGFIFIPIAVSQIIQQPTSRAIALRWLPDWITFGALGWVFLALAGAAFLCGLFSKWLPSRFLGIGYMLAFLPPAFLAIVYFISLCFGLWMSGIVSFAIYAGFASLIYLIGGWEEPRPSPPLTDGQRQMLTGEDR